MSIEDRIIEWGLDSKPLIPRPLPSDTAAEREEFQRGFEAGYTDKAPFAETSICFLSGAFAGIKKRLSEKGEAAEPAASWDYCRPCEHVQHYEQRKVFLNQPEAAATPRPDQSAGGVEPTWAPWEDPPDSVEPEPADDVVMAVLTEMARPAPPPDRIIPSRFTGVPIGDGESK
jgi:hypothetical protein